MTLRGLGDFLSRFFVAWLGEEHARSLGETCRIWSSHTLVVCVFLFGIWVVEKFSYILWSGRLPRLFGAMPFEYIFHAADAAVVGIFLFYGGYRAFRAYIKGS